MRTPCAAQPSARWAQQPCTAITAAAAAATAAARRLRCPHPPGMPGARSAAPRRASRLAASGGSGSGEGEGIDIDALAARLSREAEKLRQSGASWSSEDDEGASDAAAYEAQPDAGRQEALRREADAGPGPDLLRPFGYATQSAEAEALAAVGNGGFSPEEFELLSELGTINIQQVSKELFERQVGGCWVLAPDEFRLLSELGTINSQQASAATLSGSRNGVLVTATELEPLWELP